MDKWGLICIIFSGIVGLVRECVRLKYDGITVIYKILWSISLVLLIIGAILYFMV
ncbi:MAG: hypothetical protein ACRDDX_02605 [Cellulosilyticaceae bacterium]